LTFQESGGEEKKKKLRESVSGEKKKTLGKKRGMQVFSCATQGPGKDTGSDRKEGRGGKPKKKRNQKRGKRGPVLCEKTRPNAGVNWDTIGGCLGKEKGQWGEREHT